MNNNPLQSYFRKPAIHMTLPSGGKFYPPGSLNIPETGELPVYPMSALDEISYRTPDALFNGSAIIEVIKSCIPAITNPWLIPSCDLTSILANIRIASFGHEMDVETTCPKCSEHSTYSIDLRQIVDLSRAPDWSAPITHGEISIVLRPLTYRQINDNNKLNFEEQQVKKIVTNTDMNEEDKIKAMSETFKKMAALSLETIANNIDVIKIPGTDVTEHKFILDFIKNCDRELYKRVKDKIVELRMESEIKPLKIKCDNDECGHEYEQPFTLDMTNFFE